MKACIPVSKSVSIPTTATAAVSQDKVNATQLKFQNFDSELTELISGLKSNLTKETDEMPIDLDDDKLLLDNDVEPIELKPVANEEPKTELIIESPAVNQSICANKRLADIVIDFNTIRPHDEHGPRCILDDKTGLKILLNFAKDKPRPDVAVLVITTTNQSHLPVTNYQFEASVSKVNHFQIYFVLKT